MAAAASSPKSPKLRTIFRIGFLLVYCFSLHWRNSNISRLILGPYGSAKDRRL